MTTRVALVTATHATTWERVRSAETLVGAALDALAIAERAAPDAATRDLVRTAQADCTALAGRLTAIAHRLEHPRPAA